MAHGLEARVPFLDVEFIEKAFLIDPADKMIVEGDDSRRETKQVEGYIYTHKIHMCIYVYIYR